jgi:uncharacterized protein (TIGR02145 family)
MYKKLFLICCLIITSFCESQIMLPSYQAIQYIYGTITSINCSSIINNGTLTAGTLASGVNSIVSYTGGDGGNFNTQIVASTGVTGLTASLTEGTFMIGNGSLTFIISGTPAGTGTANFTFSIGGRNCILRRIVYCSNTVTAIVNVTNPITGKTWMDRNLGASQVATSSDDYSSYGDFYQWGRLADGHQCPNSPATNIILSSSDQPTVREFLVPTSSPMDWRIPQNSNLWQGVNGINNPCPIGYRLPTYAELDAERASWISNNGQGAFASRLKWSQAGSRRMSGPLLVYQVQVGQYWSSTVNGTNSFYLSFYNSDLISSTIEAEMFSSARYVGMPVRCIKN